MVVLKLESKHKIIFFQKKDNDAITKEIAINCLTTSVPINIIKGKQIDNDNQKFFDLLQKI